MHNLNTIQDLYIAYYQRPGDPAGMQYWAESDATFDQLMASFGNSPESIALYGPINEDTIGSVIDSIYMGLFARPPDIAGKAFYISGFLDGTFTPASIAYNILVGAQNEDAFAVKNKETAANRFSKTCVDAATYAGDADVKAARGWLSSVTADPATVPTELQTVEFIKDNIADPGDPILGGGIPDSVPGFDHVVNGGEWDWNNAQGGGMSLYTGENQQGQMNPSGPMGPNGILIITFVAQATDPSWLGDISIAPYPGTLESVPRTTTISEVAGDISKPYPWTHSGIDAGCQFCVGHNLPEIYINLVAGRRYYLNICNRDAAGNKYLGDFHLQASSPKA